MWKTHAPRREHELLGGPKGNLVPVPRPNQSELWQRLRTARELARKTPDDVGRLLGLSHSAVALWESPDPATRTTPSAQQVIRIAKLCGLPPFLLVDDAVSTQDIRSFTGL